MKKQMLLNPFCRKRQNKGVPTQFKNRKEIIKNDPFRWFTQIF